MFLKFYPDEAEAAANFAVALGAGGGGGGGAPTGVSMAMLQGFFMAHRNEPAVAVLASTHALLEEAAMVRDLQAQMEAEAEAHGSALTK